MLDDVRMAARFVRALPGYLRRPLTPEECRARLTRQLEQREASLLSILERGVFGNAQSPYLALARQARIDRGDLASSVRQHGVERTLGELYDAGVYVTLDETQVVAMALDVLERSSSANRMMARYWRDAQTLRVVRREPYVTHAAKILPLHVIQRTERPSP
jgi:hypothetical protein